MVDSVDDVLELGGNISDDTTFGTRGEDLADLSNDSLDLMGDVDKISLGDGSIGVEDMVDAIEDILELGGNISDDTTFGTGGKDLADLSNDSLEFVGNVDKITFGTRGKDLADLSNDSLDLVGDVDKISLGDGGIGVEDMVDSVDDVLELGGNISDDTTFGTR